MADKTKLEDWDEVSANNLDLDGVTLAEGQTRPPMVNDLFRKEMAQVAKWLGDDTIVAAATTDIGALPGRYISVTGNTAITSFGTIKAGTIKYLRFTGTPTLTYNVTSMILPTSANIIAAVGDTAIVASEGSGNWRVLAYSRATGLNLSPAVALMDTRANILVNSSMQDSPENGTALGTVNGYFPAEMFALYFSAATAAMSVQLISNRALSGNDRQIEFKTTTAKAVLAATDFVTITTIVEGSRPEWKAAAFGTASATPFVFRIDQTLPAGPYHIHASNSAGNRNISIPFTATGSEAVITVAIPGDVTGTWLTADGTKGLVIDIVLAAGSTLTGGTASTWGATAYLAASTQFNILSSTSNVARIADVGLKNDPDATAVYGLFRVGEKDVRYNSDWYWEKSYMSGVAVGTATEQNASFVLSTTAGVGIIDIQFKQKCKAASLTTYNPLSGAIGTWQSGATPYASSVLASGDKSVTIQFAAIPDQAAARGHWTANARL